MKNQVVYRYCPCCRIYKETLLVDNENTGVLPSDVEGIIGPDMDTCCPLCTKNMKTKQAFLAIDDDKKRTGQVAFVNFEHLLEVPEQNPALLNYETGLKLGIFKPKPENNDE